MTTIHYLVRKEMRAAKAAQIVSTILRVFDVAAVDGGVIEAPGLPCADFEGAVRAAAAGLARCDYIVTQDPQGIRGSSIRSLTPEMVLPLLSAD